MYKSLVKLTKIKFLTVCEIFFKLKFSKFMQNIRALIVFGKFLLIVYVRVFWGF